jgi:transcriptional regulator with XRE-family HTH domain
VAPRLSQEELADRSGRSVRAMAHIERGRTGRPLSIQSLANALGLAERSQLREASHVAGNLDTDLAQPRRQLTSPGGRLSPALQA